MVQVLGRLALSVGILSVAGLSGWLAGGFAAKRSSCIGLVIPALSVMGVLLIRAEVPGCVRSTGASSAAGLRSAAIVVALALGGVPFGQELIFVMSMSVICTMLVLVTRELDHKSRMAILFTTIIIFAFRATPAVGDGYFWWTLDVLKFDEAFYGHCARPGRSSASSSCGCSASRSPNIPPSGRCCGSRSPEPSCRCPLSGSITACITGPSSMFGFGARTIAVVDAAAALRSRSSA